MMTLQIPVSQIDHKNISQLMKLINILLYIMSLSNTSLDRPLVFSTKDIICSGLVNLFWFKVLHCDATDFLWLSIWH